ncbi:SET domain-containing protein [Decorospora gaudefroyi]|uniref:SET domain-containing protein n=1 Tax=Decorospora gaudefroyi TaxID=184978 RepID=A0A6A5K9N0_9PLEO|nr:SET domain-containing protein [Decorospora gaudefroyi]
MRNEEMLEWRWAGLFEHTATWPITHHKTFPGLPKIKPIVPHFITALKFDASLWTSRPKPPNYHGVWPPTAASHLMNVDTNLHAIGSLAKQANFLRKNGDLVKEPCLGKYCWQSTAWGSDFFCAQDFDARAQCDHSVPKWMTGCSSWKLRFEIRSVPRMGYGLYAKQRWAKGDILGLYLGELIPEPGVNTDYCHQVKIGPEFSNAEAQVAYVNARRFGNYTRFANHSCDNNANIVEARIGDERVLALRAIRNIDPGEQVSVDYRSDYFRKRRCCCGSNKCKYSKPIDLVTAGEKCKLSVMRHKPLPLLQSVASRRGARAKKR